MNANATANLVGITGIARRLVLDGVLGEADARKALDEASKQKRPIHLYLLEKKLVTSAHIAGANAVEFGMPLFDSAALDLNQAATKLVSEELITKHQALPLFKRGNRLFVGVSDPTNHQAVTDVQFSTGLTTEPLLVEDDKLTEAIEKFFDTANSGMEELGGARTHNQTSGVAHYLAEDEVDAIDYARSLLSYLPENNLSETVVYAAEGELEITDEDQKLNTIIPDSPNQPYDMRSVIESIVDGHEFLEVQPLFAPNILIGFARIDGRSVGIIANQPQQMAGTLNIEAGEKAARFVRFCDAFSIPILTLVDVPGYLPGTDQEWAGVIRRGAKLLYAYAEATVPLVTVITRKAYGGAYVVMDSKSIGSDLAFAPGQLGLDGAA